MAAKTQHTTARIARHQRRRPVAPAFTLLPVTAAVMAAFGLTVSGPARAQSNVITPDGRTQTRLDVHGKTTDITTQTTRGRDAFNSFHRFEEAKGHTVNLHLPGGTDNLINLVRDRKVLINGTLNSLKNGAIGGHVFFADPHGMVVGQSGVLNVSALTITTPTQKFMDGVISADGTIHPHAVAALKSGNAPQSSNSTVQIKGKINAHHSVRITAHSIDDSGVILVQQQAGDGDLSAGAAVNTGPRSTGTQLARTDDGSIELVATGDATISGQLGAHTAQRGGTISITADHNVHATDTRINASAGDHGDGGTIRVSAGHNIAANNLHVSALGGTEGGDGGLVDISARGKLSFTGHVDTGAAHGKIGTLLLDPDKLYIVNSNTAPHPGGSEETVSDQDSAGSLNTGTDSYITVGTLQTLGDTNVTLLAYDTLTIGDKNGGATDLKLDKLGDGKTLTFKAGGADPSAGAGDVIFNDGSSIETGGGSVVIDAGAGFAGAAGTSGKATLGSITTDGGAITVNAGGAITLPKSATLDSTSSHAHAGNITLTATQEAANDDGLFDVDDDDPDMRYQNNTVLLHTNSTQADATATIDIYGTVSGGSVAFTAASRSAVTAPDIDLPDAVSIAQHLFDELGIDDTPLLQAYQFKSSSKATVTLHKSASVSGHTVSLNTDAAPGIDLSNGLTQNSKYLSAVAADVGATSKAIIEDGATITLNGPASPALNVTATAEPDLDMTLETDLDGSGASLTLAYGHASVTTQAHIEHGAEIRAADNTPDYDVTVSARNTQSFSVAATANATTNGDSKANAGVAVALTNLDTTASATEAAELADADDVIVSADSTTTSNATSATTGVSAGGEDKPDAPGDDQQEAISTLLNVALSAVQDKAGALGDSAGTLGDIATNGLPDADNETDTEESVEDSSNTTGLNFGSALALGFGQQTADAHIGYKADDAAKPTTIHASGNVTVAARNVATGLDSKAESATSSTDESDDQNGGESKNGVSLAAALSWQTRTAKAYITADTDIEQAKHIGVNASTQMPLAFLQPYSDAYNMVTSILDGFADIQSGKDYNGAYAALVNAYGNLSSDDQKAAFKVFLDDTKTLTSDLKGLSGSFGNAKQFVGTLATAGPRVLDDYNNFLADYDDLPDNFQDAWDNSNAKDVYDQIKASLTSPEYFNAYAMATANDADNLGLAGAVNYLSLTNTANAWAGPDASVTLNKSFDTTGQSWSTTLPGGDDKIKLDWAAPAIFSANNNSAVLTGSGNGLADFFQSADDTGGKAGVGASFDWTDVANTANAWIAQGAQVTTSNNDLAIAADNTDHVFAVTPSSGKGASYAGNGAGAVVRMADGSRAEIDRRARIDAGGGGVALRATSTIQAFGLAGALTQGENAGVGIGVAVALVNGDTTAAITDTSPLTTTVTDRKAAQDCDHDVCITAGSLDVDATTRGAIGTLAVAGAESGSKPEEPSGGEDSGAGHTGGLLGQIKGATAKIQDSVRSQSSTSDDAGDNQSIEGGENLATSSGSNARSNLDDTNDDDSQQGTRDSLQANYKDDPDGAASDAGGSDTGSGNKPKVDLAIAGSAAVNKAALDTRAKLDGASIKLTGDTGASVHANRKASVFAASGAGALSRAGGGGNGFKAAIAGTLGMNLLNSQTTAAVGDTTLTLTGGNAGANIRAMAGGEAVAVGLGLGINIGGGKKNLATVAGSGSVTIGRDTTSAAVTDSKVTVKNDTDHSTADASIQAYDATDIGTGGGALSVSGSKAGLGIGLSATMTGNDTLARIAGSTVTGFSGVDVGAYSPDRIISVAATGGLGTSSKQVLSLAGAVVLDQLANTTSASIGADTDGNKSTIAASSTISVTATTQANTAFVDALDDINAYSGDLLEDNFDLSKLPGLDDKSLGGQTTGSGKEAARSKQFTATGTDSTAPGASIIAVAGSLSAGVGKVNAGISAVYAGINNTTTAAVDNAELTLGTKTNPGSLDIHADDSAQVISVAAGLAATTGKLAGVGSFTINNLGSSTQARLGDSGATGNTTRVNGAATDQHPDVGVKAEDAHTVWSAAGSFAAGKKAAAGAALALNLNRQNTSAEIVHSHVTAANTTVNSISSTGLYSGAIAGAASGKVALGGSLDITIDQGHTQSKIDHSTLDLTGGLTSKATDTGDIWDGAGALSASGKAAFGVAAAINITQHDVEASLGDSQLSASDQSVDVVAERSGFIASGAVGAAGSGTVAGGLAAVANVAGDTVTAHVDNLTNGTDSNQDIKPAELARLDVKATDSASIYAIGGQLAASGKAALGGAVTVNWLDQDVDANLTNSTIAASDAINITAESTGKIGSLAATLAASGKVAVAGAFSVNIDNNSATAKTSGSTFVDDTSPNVKIAATNGSSIKSLAGSVAASGTAAAGIALAFNQVDANTTAALTDGSYHAHNVTVSADSTNPNRDNSANIQTLAAGVGVSGKVGGAGSVAINLEGGQTTAKIADGAAVTAQDNVAVLAHNRQGVNVLAGSLGVGASRAGIGVGVIVNDLDASTNAYIAGAGTSVDALAVNSGDTVAVRSGTLTADHDVAGVDSGKVKVSDLGSYTSPDLSENTTNVTGLAVNAATQQNVASLGAAAAFAFNPEGSAAIAATAGVNVLGGDTRAYISAAQINQADGASADQNVNITASSHTYTANIIAGAALGTSDVSGAAAVHVNNFNQTTQAYVDQALLASKGDTTIRSRASQQALGVTAGVSGSIVGIAGTGIINLSRGDTEAYLTLPATGDDDNDEVQAKNLTVAAHSKNTANLYGGSAALGGIAAGATFLLDISHNKTNAYIQGLAGAGNRLLVPGTVDVTADSATRLDSTALTASISAAGSLAGMAAVSLLGNHTNAYLDRVQLNEQPGDVAADNVNIAANEKINLSPKTNAGAVSGGAAAGAAANVIVLDSQVGAAIKNSGVNARGGAADVTANSDKIIDALTISGALSGSLSISGAAGVIVFGKGSLADNNQDDDPLDELNKGGDGTLAKVNEFGDSGGFTGRAMQGVVSDKRRSDINSAGQPGKDHSLLDASGNLNLGEDGTTATIAHSTVDSNQLTVKATDTNSISNIVGNLAIGGFVGAGGAVGFTLVRDTVGATINPQSTIHAHSATVKAEVNNGKTANLLNGVSDAISGLPTVNDSGDYAAQTIAIQGAAGAVGLGAAVAISEIDNTVQASVAGDANGLDKTRDSLVIEAGDHSATTAAGGGATAGGLAAGIVVAQAKRSSHVTSALGHIGASQTADGSNARVDSFRDVTITAENDGGAKALAAGVSAGIISGDGVDADAIDTTDVKATAGHDAEITGGHLTLKAQSEPTVSAGAWGVNAGGFAIGVSRANSEASGHVTAQLGDGVTTTRLASAALVAHGQPTVTSQAFAGEGALLGVQGVISKASNKLDVKALTGDHVTLRTVADPATGATGDIDISARQDGTVGASGKGLLGGLAVAGAVLVNADATPTVEAELGPDNDSGDDDIDGQLAVTAVGRDTLSAKAVSGTGGALAGDAAAANTNLDATTIARTQGTNGELDTGTFKLHAAHSANIARSEADSTNVSLIGLGAAQAANSISSIVRAVYGAGTDIRAGSASITAENNVFQPEASGGWNADGKSGGGINFNSITAQTTGALATQALVKGGHLDVTGDPDTPEDHMLTIGTHNTVDAHIAAKVATGGAVEGLTAKAAFNMLVDRNTPSIVVDNAADLSAAGNVRLYSGTSANILTNSYAHTWGGAGVVNSDAQSTLQNDQNIKIAGTVHSSNDITIGAGQDVDNGDNSLILNADSQAYNYTVLALHTDPDADATLINRNNINITASGAVKANGNVNLTSMKGGRSLEGTATGENSYEKVVSKVANFFGGLVNSVSHAFGGGTVIKHLDLKYHGGSSHDNSTARVTVAGTVMAGLAGDQGLTLVNDGNGGVTRSDDSSPLVQYQQGTWDYHQNLKDQLDTIEDKIKHTPDDDTEAKGRLGAAKQQVQQELDAIQGKHHNVTTITLAPIRVRSGSVVINAGHTDVAAGTVKAAPFKGVTIKNETPAFLRVGKITVGAGTGGHVFVNGRLLSSSSDSTPTVDIRSTYTPATDGSNMPPDIFLDDTIYNPTGPVTITDSAGSIHQQGAVQAASVDIAAPNGAFYQGFQAGYHAPGGIEPITNPDSHIIAGGPVFVAAQYLNVNGLIQSGHDHLTTTWDSQLTGQLAAWQTLYAISPQVWKNYIKGNDKVPVDPSTGYVRLSVPASIKHPDVIPAFWDPKTDRIVLNAAESKPGRVYLYGNIFNTSPDAKIVAAGGLASIDADNPTDLPMVVNKLDAGATNRGGIVQITDTAKQFEAPNSKGKLLSWSRATSYQYSPADGVLSVYKFAAGAPGDMGKTDAATRVATYKLSTTDYAIADNGGGSYYVAETGDYSTDSDTYQLAQGIHRPDENSGIEWAKLALNDSRVYDAGHPIAVNFIGKNHGSIKVDSAPGIWLKGDITNPTGPVTLKAGNGVLGSLSSTATVKAVNIRLTGHDGIGAGNLQNTQSIPFILAGLRFFDIPLPTDRAGTKTSHPLNVALAGNTGYLNAASADGNITLVDTDGDLTLGTVTASGGSVNIRSTGNIAAAANGGQATITSGDLTLSSQTGSIHGSRGAADALRIDTCPAGDCDATQQRSSVLNVNAPQGAVNLSQVAAAGVLNVGQIIAGGDVTLTAKGGSIISALSKQLDQAAIKQLKKRWAALGLTGSAAEQEANDSLDSIVTGYQSIYRQYWRLQAMKNHNGGALSDTLTKRYQSVQKQLDRLKTDYGFDDATLSHFLRNDKPTDFAKVVRDHAQPIVLTGAQLTPDLLLNAVNKQRIFGSSPTLPEQGTNIRTPGRVTLNTTNGDAGIGNVEQPVTIQLPTDDNQALSLDPTQAAALAAAMPGDIAVDNGMITITRYHPMYTQGAEQVDATAAKGAYLRAGTGNFNVGTITSRDGSIRLSAVDSLLQAPHDPNHERNYGLRGAPDGTTLRAVNGSIGSAQWPLNIALSGPLHLAKADDDVYLDSLFKPFVNDAVPLTLNADDIIASHGSIHAQIHGDLFFDVARAQNGITMDAMLGSITGDPLYAQTADLSARDTIHLDSADLNQHLNLAATDIDVNFSQPDPPPEPVINLIVTGYHDGIAHQVRFTADAPRGLLFNQLASQHAHVDTTADKVRIERGYIGKTLRLNTPSTRLLMDNTTAKLDPDVDVQLMQPKHRFYLTANGRFINTNAFVTHYARGYQSVQVNNYNEAHQDASLTYGGGSATRYGERLLGHGQASQGNNHGSRWGNFQWGSDMLFGTPAQSLVSAPVTGAAVNTGVPDDDSRH